MMNFSARLSLIFVLREGHFAIGMGYRSDIARISEKMRREKPEFTGRLFVRRAVLHNG